MSDAVVIRRAHLHDVPMIGQLWHQLATYHRGLDDTMPRIADDGVEKYCQMIRAELDDASSAVFVLATEDAVVGYVFGMIMDILPNMFAAERAGFLADIFVLPQHRGMGYGRQLVETLKDWFRMRGMSHFEWYVASSNVSGIEFWRAMGGRDVMMRMRGILDEA